MSSIASATSSGFSIGRESQLDKLIKAVERANSSLLNNISETESQLARAVEDCIKNSTRDFDETLQVLMSESKMAEEQEQMKIFELEERIRKENINQRLKSEFLASQINASKHMHQQSKHALETSHYLNQKNLKVLGFLDETENSNRLERLNELRRKKQVIETALDSYVNFTGFQVVQEGEGMVKMYFANLNPQREEDVAVITLSSLNEAFVLTHTEPRLENTFEIVQYLTTFKNLGTFIRLVRSAFVKHYQDLPDLPHPPK
jgi:Chromosome segregation protein Spc25